MSLVTDPQSRTPTSMTEMPCTACKLWVGSLCVPMVLTCLTEDSTSAQQHYTPVSQAGEICKFLRPLHGVTKHI